MSAPRLRPAASVHARRFDDELVILDMARGEYFALDEIGSLLWEAIESGIELDELVEKITSDYDVTREQASSDLASLRKELLARGLVVEVAP